MLRSFTNGVTVSPMSWPLNIHTSARTTTRPEPQLFMCSETHVKSPPQTTLKRRNTLKHTHPVSSRRTPAPSRQNMPLSLITLLPLCQSTPSSLKTLLSPLPNFANTRFSDSLAVCSTLHYSAACWQHRLGSSHNSHSRNLPSHVFLPCTSSCASSSRPSRSWRDR